MQVVDDTTKWQASRPHHTVLRELRFSCLSPKRFPGDIQAAYSTEDISTLRAKVTPEMLSYLSEQLAGNASRGLINRVTDLKLLQGDLAEAWREGNTGRARAACSSGHAHLRELSRP